MLLNGCDLTGHPGTIASIRFATTSKTEAEGRRSRPAARLGGRGGRIDVDIISIAWLRQIISQLQRTVCNAYHRGPINTFMSVLFMLVSSVMGNSAPFGQRFKLSTTPLGLLNVTAMKDVLHRRRTDFLDARTKGLLFTSVSLITV